MGKTVEKSVYYDRIKKKTEEIILCNESISDYLKHLIIPKTYGSFRVYANSIERVLDDYQGSAYITDNEIAEIKTLMMQKRIKKDRLLDVSIDYNSYFFKFAEYLDILPRDVKIDRAKANSLLITPLLPFMQVKDVIELKISDVFIEDCTQGKLLRVEAFNSLIEEQVTHHIFFKQYGDIYERVLRRLENDYPKEEFLFSYNEVSGQHRRYKVLGEQLENEFRKFVLNGVDAFMMSPLKILKETFEKSISGRAITKL